MKQYYIYILECADKSFYIGITSNLEHRLNIHNAGTNKDSYTYSRRPVQLKWMEAFTDPNLAIAVEKKLKGWSRRKKQALIDEDWERLILFSKNHTQFGKNEASSTGSD